MYIAKHRKKPVFAALFSGLLAMLGMPSPGYAEAVPHDRLTHIHGISVNPEQPQRLLLATHTGLFAATDDGMAEKIPTLTGDLMSFVTHPRNPAQLYASGHVAKGGNLGVLVSGDGGANWRRISQGTDKTIGLHALAISGADTNVLYGIHNDLKVSRDGGKSWARAGEIPKGIFGIAASARDVNVLYAATRAGLLFSKDGGRNWSWGYTRKAAATMVHVTPTGKVYAFIYGVGLVSMTEPNFAWNAVSTEFKKRYIVRLAVAPNDQNRLYAAADTGAVMTSKDGGRTWTTFEGNHKLTPKNISRGRQLYEETCQACHGVKGIGERPGDMYAKDEFGYVAPPLNDDAHGWHHSDRQLVGSILNGSARNKRMIAWKETLSQKDAEDLVVYIKSLWNFRSLACQGARHMKCMH